MIQNPSVVGSGGNAENVPVVFYASGVPSSAQIIYTTVENGDVVFKNEMKDGGVGTIYALKGSVLYCTARNSAGIILNISSGGTMVASGTYQGRYAQDYDFRVYQVTG